MSDITSIELIRNATLLINYGGKKILVDPMFSAKGTFESFGGIAKNPGVDLPVSIKQITEGLDLVLVSHTHIDHMDPKAQKVLDKNLPFFIQPSDKEFFVGKGFRNVRVIECTTTWEGITICRTVGQHGSGEILQKMGHTSGFILQKKGYPTIYIIGDSILTLEVTMTIERFRPDIIVTNSGGAVVPGFEDSPILMEEKQTMELIKRSGSAKVIAVHMEALDHCRTTRASLRQLAIQQHISESKLLIPLDGEKILF
ncbi:MBL fold metallo-hydrolase [Mucilaginibacter sp. R-33]|uniref:MBL fold metallo-hydrolase n=1 Tax=Mucilaginibacter sp. R-33 TaxID=3416711 RepID=UPI003CECB26F